VSGVLHSVAASASRSNQPAIRTLKDLMKYKILVAVGALTVLGSIAAYANGFRCTFCKGTGFQGNLPCYQCKGSGVLGY